MSRLALVSAMQEELSAVLACMHDVRVVRVGGRQFHEGRLVGHDVVAVLSGIGKVSAATTASVLIERFGIAQLVFTGVAGGLDPAVRVGDVVVAQEFMQHDMDASPLFPRFEIPLYGRAVFATHAALCGDLAQAAVRATQHMDATVGAQAVAHFGLHAPQVHTGLVISGDRFVSTTRESQILQTLLPRALAVEMEGAAIAQVCHDYQVPYAAVRTISDRADDAAHHDFLSFIREVASRYSVCIVTEWLRAREGAALT